MVICIDINDDCDILVAGSRDCRISVWKIDKIIDDN